MQTTRLHRWKSLCLSVMVTYTYMLHVCCGMCILYRWNSTYSINQSVTINGCSVDEHFDLTQCGTSVLTSNCSTNDIAWVECEKLGEKLWLYRQSVLTSILQVVVMAKLL